MGVPRFTRPVAMLADSEGTAGSWALGTLAAFLVTAIEGAFAFARYETIQITWLDALIGLSAAIVARGGAQALTLLAGGGRPRLIRGFRRPIPYLGIGSGVPIRRAWAVVTTLAPLILVDLAGLGLGFLPVTTGIGLVVVLANTTGSVPDLWRAGRLLRLPGWVGCELRGPSVVIWTPEEHDREPVQVGSQQARETPAAAGVLGTWALCLLVTEAVCAGTLRLVAQWHGDIRVAGVPLASTEQFVSGPDVVLNFLPVIVGGAALGTLAAAVWVLFRQISPLGGLARLRASIAPRHP